MHDGSLATLEDVVAHCEAGGRNSHAGRTNAIRPLRLSHREKADLIAFLRTLTDEALLTDKRWSDPWR